MEKLMMTAVEIIGEINNHIVAGWEINDDSIRDESTKYSVH